MRIVADTNLLISSIFWSGAPYKIVGLALEGKIEIVTSSLILEEVRTVLKRDFELDEETVNWIINSITSYAKIVEPQKMVKVVERDPTDDHIISCALAAKADFIVTRDNDLLEIQNYGGITILNPEEFLKRTSKV